jgi:inner membrane protein
MDNVCHTLVGLALGEAGLKRKTALGNATLVIGANLPDVDALAYLRSPVIALGFRRGWTHGVLAMAVWPFVLAGAMLWLDGVLRRRGGATGEPARFRPLLLLAALSVWSHPLLDLLNTYGVRLLMPFSGRWFYGDTLFIVDPWVWLMLGLGIVVARLRGRVGEWERRRERYAQVGLFCAAVYIGIMAVSAAVLHRGLALALSAHEPAPSRIMVAPAPLNPFHRDIVIEMADRYASGMMTWFGRRELIREWTDIPKHDLLPEARAAAATAEGRAFLAWARFPFYDVGQDCAPSRVCIRDARYYPQRWAEVAVPVGGAVSLRPPAPPGNTP